MPVPQQIIELVDRFERNLESYKSGSYNETQTRREFLDPFFEALGWDVSNKQGYAEAYKDVVHEYSQKTADSTEAPDYLFRIGGTRKFFVEAKKPSVKLADDISPAYQLRRYAWTAKLPLSILTDFEEFAVYDCRIKPNKNDKPSTARIHYYTYKDYIDKWDEIASVFSKDAILKGSFDKFAETNKGKRGTAEVDDAFLKEIETWRESLAKNIAIRNSKLSNRELNYSVQKIIDRIIFLRICEDRGIEEYGQLMNLLNGTNVYKRLLQIFTRADEKYNSGLFHFEKEKDRPESPDELTPKINIDDKTLKEIIKTLYYPDSPYEFSVLPADILGHVYEQFLGKVIRLTPSHQAKIEEKPEVKKAGGVYYTPTYIVDYIVKNTLGKLLTDDKTPKHVSKIKILDPACGSGSFLIVAYQYLLDWHLKYYINNEPGKLSQTKNPPVYLASNGEWKLTTAERKRILLNNIYGVDIDPQAVEVTKLSLLLKVLEGETEETLTSQFKFFRERALPDLGSNIKCGNSLIGPDFYSDNLFVGTGHVPSGQIDDEERMRINVFDWHKEFPEVFKSTTGHSERSEESNTLASSENGFDIVIGNPPYLKLTKQSYDKNSLTYFDKSYKSIHGGSSKNLFQLFIEKSFYLHPQYVSFIVPESILTTSSNSTLRSMMVAKNKIISLVTFNHYVFESANIGTIIFVMSKDGPNVTTIEELLPNGTNNVIKSLVLPVNGSPWEVSVKSQNIELLRKIEEQGILLGQISTMSKGMVIKNRKEHLIRHPNKGYLPFLLGSSIERYYYQPKFYANYNQLIIVGGTRDYDKQTKIPRLLIRRTGDILCAVFSQNVELIESTLYILTSENIDLKYLLSIINSRLLTFYLRQKLITNKQGYPQILMWQLEQIPIITNADNNCKKKLINLVDQIIHLKNSSTKINFPQEKAVIQRQIDAVDKEIDRLVYELYGLTEEEIKIVESS